MKRSLLCVPLVVGVAAYLLPVFAKAPHAVEEVAPIEDLEFEVNARIAELEMALDTEESYEDLKEDDIRLAFGVLACMGQAIAEHQGASKTEIAGPSLRDAALGFHSELTYAEAQAALEAAQAAASGEADEAVALDHDWANLIDMYTMMEEIEVRSGKLVRVARRPRGKPEESAHASTIAVLSLAMMADTHEVQDAADIPQWTEMSREYQQVMTRLSSAIREKDRKSAGDLLRKAAESCDRCHEKFCE